MVHAIGRAEMERVIERSWNLRLIFELQHKEHDRRSAAGDFKGSSDRTGLARKPYHPVQNFARIRELAIPAIYTNRLQGIGNRDIVRNDHFVDKACSAILNERARRENETDCHLRWLEIGTGAGHANK